jgi:predicted ribosome quality control (RQC) complex YloA/Tae2 family protein
MVSGGAVFVNGAGQLGLQISSARFKDELKSMDKVSEAVLALRPVTFRYKNEIDPDCTPQFGLVAEEVERVDPDLVIRDPEGKPYAVRYEAVNAMLLNEFLKEHKTVQELKKEIAALIAKVQQQDSRIQKVSDQIELRKPAQQLAGNNR